MAQWASVDPVWEQIDLLLAEAYRCNPQSLIDWGVRQELANRSNADFWARQAWHSQNVAFGNATFADYESILRTL